MSTSSASVRKTDKLRPRKRQYKPPGNGILLTKGQLSAQLPMPERTIEKFVANGVIPALKITPRMVRFELPAVLAALRQYQTVTLSK